MELGHEYLAITDHSPRLTVANGLSAPRLRAQLDQVAALNRAVGPFRVLTGIEVDILDDGGARPGPGPARPSSTSSSRRCTPSCAWTAGR